MFSLGLDVSGHLSCAACPAYSRYGMFPWGWKYCTFAGGGGVCRGCAGGGERSVGGRGVCGGGRLDRSPPGVKVARRVRASCTAQQVRTPPAAASPARALCSSRGGRCLCALAGSGATPLNRPAAHFETSNQNIILIPYPAALQCAVSLSRTQPWPPGALYFVRIRSLCSIFFAGRPVFGKPLGNTAECHSFRRQVHAFFSFPVHCSFSRKKKKSTYDSRTQLQIPRCGC